MLSPLRRQRPTIATLLVRCLKLRCPACGRSAVFDRPFHVKERCGSCRAVFKREEGFFVGAILVAVITTELVILLTYLASMPIIEAHYELVIGILCGLALLFPLLFFHHSWSIWLSFDHLVEGLPRGKDEG